MVKTGAQFKKKKQSNAFVKCFKMKHTNYKHKNQQLKQEEETTITAD